MKVETIEDAERALELAKRDADQLRRAGREIPPDLARDLSWLEWFVGRTGDEVRR